MMKLPLVRQFITYMMSLIAIALAVTARPGWAMESPVNVADKTQLFVDRLLVRDTQRVWFGQHQGKKHPENRLLLNARTDSGGQVVVELCDAAGRPFEDWPCSEPFSGDKLRHVVRFGDKTDVSALAGQAIRLRFHLKSAELFSFKFDRGLDSPAAP